MHAALGSYSVCDYRSKTFADLYLSNMYKILIIFAIYLKDYTIMAFK